MIPVTVRGLTAGYGGHRVLDGLDLEVPAGALLAVLGDSGSGKTTLLRVLAGFLTPAAGTVRFGDRVVAAAGPGTPGVFVPPEKRHVGIVPQEGALFPHLSVGRNVGFGLPRDAGDRIAAALDMVGMGDYAQARPHELSGGQQQRVALARALAPRPDVMLLDEPFSSLDAALRVRLRGEVRDLLGSLGITTLLVTHDQDEALSTADLVAVVRDGRIVQQGTPREVYTMPVDLGVAHFLGDAVQLPARRTPAGAVCALGEVTVDGDCPAGRDEVVVVLRPEQIALAERPGTGHVSGSVREVSYHGHDALVTVELADGERIPIRMTGSDPLPAPGADVGVRVIGPGRIFTAPQPHRGGSSPPRNRAVAPRSAISD